MQIIAKTLDDLLRKSYLRILKTGISVDASRGRSKEVSGALLVLTNPLARLSHTEKKGKVFSALGEFAWYLAGSNSGDFISYYISRYKEETEQDGTVNGAYGPRLFRPLKSGQFNRILNLLEEKPSTRKAVIQIFDKKDLYRDYKDVPCTCTLQFMVRSGRLDLIVTMRSNDAYFGLPHDIFTFTMLQEYMARLLNLEPGTYRHFAASLHIYEDHIESVRKYIDEGWQDSIVAAMPPMPKESPRTSVRQWLNIEHSLRAGQLPEDFSFSHLDSYWGDLARLLCVWFNVKNNTRHNIRHIVSKMNSRVYREYIIQRSAPKKSMPRLGKSQLFTTETEERVD